MLIEGFGILLNDPFSLVWIVFGVFVGIIFGAIPGLTATMAIAVFLPITFSLNMSQAFALLMALYIGGISGGLISAILLNMPGTPASIATCFDGAPMAQRGEAGKALGISIIYSFFGTVVGIVALMFISPMLATVAIKFGPEEYFAITVFSLTLIIVLSADSLVKGFISGIVGLILATVGLDPITASARFTFGIVSLRSGFGILTVMVGLFAISEVLTTAAEMENITEDNMRTSDINGFNVSKKEIFSQIPNGLKSSIIGILIGILPGIGGGTSNLIAYSMAKTQSKYPEKFGTGIIDGLVASESSNNASIGGAMVPLITLGIPGDTTTAILLGAFAIHGLSPGPLVFEKYGSLIYFIFIAMLLSSLCMLFMEIYFMKGFVRILRIPKYYLYPLIVVMCYVGAFGVNNRIFDMIAVLAFGVIGFALKKLDYPLTPIILGFVLGGTLETKLRQGLSANDGNLLLFFKSPIAGTIFTITLVFIVFAILRIVKTRRNIKKTRSGL
jgi:putative tricarboxylic transport membrane protein